MDYAYDALNRLTTLFASSLPGPSDSSQAGTGEPGALSTFQYDALSRRIRLIRDSLIQTTYSYDSANRLLRLTHLKLSPSASVPSHPQAWGPRLAAWPARWLAAWGLPEASAREGPPTPQPRPTPGHIQAGQRLVELAYTYDVLGNRLTQEVAPSPEPPARSQYTYDALSQLTNVHTDGTAQATYVYDAVGNRVQVTEPTRVTAYTPNALNQYATVTPQPGSPMTFTYDLNGNLTFDGTNTYTYDSEHRLLSAQSPAHSTQSQYDPLGRRLSNTVNGVTTYFLYDGDQLLAETEASGTLQATHVSGPGLDEVLTFQQGGSAYSPLTDALGSTVALVDATGTLIERTTYDAYGTPTTQLLTPPPPTGKLPAPLDYPRLFTGREYDQETGLLFLRERSYHPGLGRFLQREPVPSDLNLYRYVRNNPTRWTDPFGRDIFNPIPPPINGNDWIGGGLSSISIDVPMPNPTGFSDVVITTPLGSLGGDFLPGPAAGTEAGNKQHNGKSTGLSVLTAQGSTPESQGWNRGGKKQDIKQVDDVARQFGMDPETRKEFGKFIDREKRATGRGDFSFQELVEKAQEFLGIR